MTLRCRLPNLFRWYNPLISSNLPSKLLLHSAARQPYRIPYTVPYPCPKRSCCLHNLNSRQAMASIDCIGELRCIGSILGVTLVTVDVQLVQACSCLHVLIIFHRIHPPRPSTSRGWIWPGPVVLEDSGESKHPGSELNIDE